jgi:hypothetical protein
LYFSYTENKTIDGQVILDMDGNGDLNNWMVERKVMKVVERETKRVIVEIEKREEIFFFFEFVNHQINNRRENMRE